MLYGPLVFLHEPAGRVLGGNAWHARRAALLDAIPPGSVVLDVGCGEGRLLREAAERDLWSVGIDPSSAMLRRARTSGQPVVQGRAEALPLRDGSVAAILVTYPGPWIREAATWREFERVLKDGGTLTVLLGGTVTRGSGTRARRLLSRVAYGSAVPERPDFLPPVGDTVTGSLTTSEDEWGSVFVWHGIVRKG